MFGQTCRDVAQLADTIRHPDPDGVTAGVKRV